jgi:hypothetical protein
MDKNTGSSNSWLWLTVPVVILLMIAAGGGVFFKGLYRDAPYFAAQAVGQDLVSLTVVIPVLVLSSFLAGRGSSRARLVWLGGLVYLVYSYMISAFDVKFNQFFLLYVALLGCSLYALIGGLVTLDMAGIKAGFTERTPVRVVSIFFAVLMVLFYFLWLNETVPALMVGGIPRSLQENGTPTNAVHVLDMAWILPAFGITAVSLWRRHPLGYTLAAILLAYCVLLISAILSMVVFMVRNGYPGVVPQVVIFVILFAASLGMLNWYLRGLKPAQ